MARPYIKLECWPTISSNHARKPDYLSTGQTCKVRPLSLAKKKKKKKPESQTITPVTFIIV